MLADIRNPMKIISGVFIDIKYVFDRKEVEEKGMIYWSL
jgi:hypothetical protein